MQTVPPNPALERLSQIKAFILDMDGTFYLGEHLLPGASEFLPTIKRAGYDYLFLTNNSSRSAPEYQQKLSSFGIEVELHKILTSGDAAIDYLREVYAGKTVAAFGTPSLVNALRAAGIEISERQGDVILLGYDTTITFEKLWKLCDHVRAGLPFIATHPDINCPIANGYMPDIGAILAFVEASTGRKPDAIIGKPYPPIIHSISKRLNLPPEALAMVGDRLYTDIALGKYGILTILTLSGETKRGDIAASEHQPGLVIENIGELSKLIGMLGKHL